MQKSLYSGKYETGSCINSMQAISYISINGEFPENVGYKCGVVNNRPVITENSIGNQRKKRNNNDPNIQV